MITGILAVFAAVTGFAMAAARTPALLEDASPPTHYPVTLQEFTDTRQVRILLTLAPLPAPTSGIEGRVTASSCTQGTPISSGSTPWSIDGVPLLALHTEEPLYRDLGPGDTGSDVRALEEELFRLGHVDKADDTYGLDTAEAVRELRSDSGQNPSEDLPVREVVWLPVQSVVPESCLPLGSQVGRGAELASLPPAVLAAAVDPLPADLTEGARTVTVGSLVLRVGHDGELDPSGVDQLAGWSGLAGALGRADPGTPVLDGTLALAQPVDAATLPASAVLLSSDGQACVTDGQRTHPITVISSQVGQSVVHFVEGPGTIPSEVEIDPDPARACS